MGAARVADTAATAFPLHARPARRNTGICCGSRCSARYPHCFVTTGIAGRLDSERALTTGDAGPIVALEDPAIADLSLKRETIEGAPLAPGRDLGSRRPRPVGLGPVAESHNLVTSK